MLLTQVIREKLELGLAGHELDELLNVLDPHARGIVPYRIFVRIIELDESEMGALAARLRDRFEQLSRGAGRSAGYGSARDAFAMFDLERSGFIARREFREAARQLGLPVLATSLEGLMDRFAQFGDPERINYTAFLKFVSRAASQPSVDFGATVAERHLAVGHGVGDRNDGNKLETEAGAVGGAGYDGLGLHGRDMHVETDPLADANVDHWLATAATPADRRSFKRLHRSLRRFQDDRNGRGRTGDEIDDHDDQYGEEKRQTMYVAVLASSASLYSPASQHCFP